MLLEDSQLWQGYISLHNNNYFLYIQEKECRNDFDCGKPANLSVYYLKVPNSVNVCFLDHSTCIVFKIFNLTPLKVVKWVECFIPSPTFDLWNSTKYRSYIRQIFSLKKKPNYFDSLTVWRTLVEIWQYIASCLLKWLKHY